ncbi:MAG: FAD:protein FMN transferase [Peptococcaceae bacterium]|jgi:thiamine biosynthesis lipoprotein|nr:FAD:protein FMN transferase [Peptococcaceae bacterium]
MKKQICILLIALALLGSAGSCARQSAKPLEADNFVLGTIVTQTIYGNAAQQVADDVWTELNRLEALLTVNASGGDANLLNARAGQGLVPMEFDTLQVLESARKISALSQGRALDITVGPLVKAWGIGTDHAQVPSAQLIRELLPLVNYQDVRIDRDQASAELTQAGQMVDLGGIAKGYAGDVVRDIYRQHGLTSAFINIGGNVVTLGARPDGNPWHIGIQNPRSETGEIVGYVSVVNQAVVTSGDYQRYFFAENGQRYCHIIDPTTGYPAESGLMSVTVITESSTDADGLSKAFILGLEGGRELLRSYGQAEGVFITTDKKIYVTPGLRGDFHFEDASHAYTYIQEG